MNKLSIALTAASLMGAAAIAAPAQAVTFADFAAANSAPNVTFSGGTLTGSGETTFNFLTLASTFQNLSADYSLTATTTAAPINAGGFDIQPGLNGTFSFTYDGPTVAGLTSGSTLLSGTFNGASISGPDGGSTGSIQDAIVSGGTVTFTSPYLNFSNTGDKALSISLTSLLPGLGIGRGGTLNAFTAVSTGSFASDISAGGGGGGVPEPASWALMLIGFAGVGIARRSAVAARRNAVA